MVQLQFLNYILSSKDVHPIIDNNVDASFFSEYPDEFKFIKEHIDTYGNVPDLETFIVKFPDFDVITVNEKISYLLSELYHDKNERLIARTCNNIKDLYMNGKTKDAEQLAKQLSEMVAKNSQVSCVNLLTDTSRYNEYVTKRDDIYKSFVRTGFPELDNIICGWDRREELATIIARPNVGKTWVLLKCTTEAVKQGLTVGLYSGEMSASKIGFRIDTLFSGISNSGIVKGKVEIQNDYQTYLKGLSSRFTGSLKVLTPPMIGGLATVSQLRAFIEKENLDILFIDQHSLLEDEKGGKTPVEKAANISKSLKSLQVLKQVPIISVSQMNRTKNPDAINQEEDDEINLTQIAQTDRIGQDSTTVIGITQKNGVLTLHLIKSRDSIAGKKLKYAIDLDKGVFTYIPIDGDGNNGLGTMELKLEFDGDSGEDVF